MLSASGLLEEAKAESGLNDYGTMEFVEGLDVLVNSINTEADLSVENEALAGIYLRRGLLNRLRMRRDVLRHPEILEEEILPPVFISSLPRTGSTKLHRMLAASGDFHAMNFWQSFNFAPFSDMEQVVPDPRIKAAEQHIEWIKAKSPAYMDAHPIYADEVDEELFLLDAGFNSLYTYAAYLNVPGYVNWVLGRDPRQAFRDMRLILQYMQWQHYRGQKKRWLLKTPALLGTEGTFADVFPGMDFIVTHRHPEKIIASVCGYFCATRKLYSDIDYADVAGASMLYNFGETVKGHLHWRDDYPADKVLDVRFSEIVGKEFELLPKIYRFLNMPFSEASRANVQAWLDRDATRRHTPRSFRLADYDVDAATVHEKFAGYIQRYANYL